MRNNRHSARHDGPRAGNDQPKCRVVFVGVLVAFVLQALATPALHAGVAVSPMQQWVSVEPGRTARFSLVLNNVVREGLGRPVRLRMSVTDFAVSRAGDLSFGREKAHERSAAGWIELDAERITVSPGEQTRVTGTVGAPLHAAGDYWATVMVAQAGADPESGVNVSLRTATGLFVHVRRRHYLAEPHIKNLQVHAPNLEKLAPDAKDHPDGRGTLRVVTDVANAGPVSLVASGRAGIYLNGRRKVASVPLHSKRRRILPGDVRRFVGLLPTPLSAGQYVARVQVRPQQKDGRTAFETTDFTLGRERARLWKKRGGGEASRGLRVRPEGLDLSVAPGRFTGARVTVENRSAGTMHVRCGLSGGGPGKQWLALKPREFTLGSRMQRSLLCRVSVPGSATSGSYEAELTVEAEVASAEGQPEAGARVLPVTLTVRSGTP